MTEVATTEQSTALAVLEIKNPALVFVKGGGDPIIDHVKAEVKKEQPNLDISTPTGRKAIASLAYKIAQTKSKFDKIGKALTEEQRAQIDAVNEERKRVEAELQKLQDEVRAPLTAWEEADKKRIADHETGIASIKGALVFVGDPTADDIRLSIDNLNLLMLRDWEEFQVRATFEHKTAIDALTKMHADKIKSDADAAELARLQKAEADRLQKEREDKIAADAKAAAEEKAAADAKALAEKVEADKKKAEDDKAALAKTLADALAKAEADKIAAAKKAEDDKKAAAAAATKAAEDKAAAAKAAEEKAAAEREADQKHKAKINNAALKAMLEAIDKIPKEKISSPTEAMKAILTAIAKGQIPNVTINY